jgi:hypothetical protein
MKNAMVIRRRICRVRRSREEIALLLESFRNSGLSQLAFSRRSGISQSTLNCWLRQRRWREGGQRECPQRLVKVKIAGDPRDCATAPRGRFELGFAGGLRLWIPQDFEGDALRRLLVVLRERC